MKKTPKNTEKFSCEYCDFKCSRLAEWNRHITTAKHINRINGIQKTPKTPKIHKCNCGKEYKYSRGLWEHKKKCSYELNEELSSKDVYISTDKSQDSSLTLELLKQNQDFQQIMKEQNKMYDKLYKENKQMRENQHKMTEQMLEIAKNSGNTNNSHNTTNNITNKFNLNVFLNETCKDAITLNDFIKSIELNTTDFARTGEIGFVKGISHVMVERIRDMEPHNRPIHCTDLKRETIYIKEDEKWEKDDANKTKLRQAVKEVAHKNQQQLYPWQDENPNYEILDTPECEKFFDYSQASLGGYGEEEDTKFENKIISNLLKEVVVEK